MLKVILLSKTPAAEEVIAKAARLCYSEKGISELQLTDKEKKKMVTKMFTLGHHSTMEHASFTFGIEGISRACSHQLVRHRLASFSQQSQRYVKFNSQFEYFTPDSIEKNSNLNKIYDSTMEKLSKIYQELIESGIPAEDARYVLPNSCCTKIIVTMNVRELLHFFNMRLCNRAQEEIRKVAAKMLSLVKKEAPEIFEKAGPTCVSYGYCHEQYKECPLYKKLIEKS
jgi:thymidylate synthase (FAD)